MHALRTLEWGAVQALLAGHCHTSCAQSEALGLIPSFEKEAVKTLIGQTREGFELLGSHSINLAGVKDVERDVKRAQKGGVLDGSTLHTVGTSVRSMREAKSILELHAQQFSLLWELGVQLLVESRLETRILSSVDGDGHVGDEASRELASIRQKVALTAKKAQERIQSYVSGRTRDLLSDSVVTTRSGRYVVPLKVENKGKIKGIVHDTSASGSTLYIEPDDVVAIGNELRSLEAAERAEVARILAALSSDVGKVADELIRGLQAAFELDLILAKARMGIELGGVVPEAGEGASVRLHVARHPLLDRKTCVPLSINLDEMDVLLITGPNTGGKTVAIKTVGLSVAMAQCGLMPLAEKVTIGCFSQLWSDIGDEQSLQQSLSTFSGHIKNISYALNNLVPGALVLLDEVGAGTDPAEGSALAQALLLEFQNRGAKVMASTHYNELKILASKALGFMNASMEFDSGSLRPTYRLLVGVPGSSHALKIAERYGVPADVVRKAGSGLSSTELDVATMIEKLATAQKQAQRAQSEADKLAARLKLVEREAELAMEKAEETRRKMRDRASEELETLLREIRIEAMDIFDDLKKSPSQAGFERGRERLKELQDVGRSFVEGTKPKAAPRAEKSLGGPVKKGSTVEIQGLSQTGIVVDEPKGGSVQVQIGPLKMNCKLSDLTVVRPGASATTKPKVSSMTVKKAMTASTEIHLRHYRAEDAQLELDRFLDEAVLGGVPTLRIVHGKGEGVLRKLTHDTLCRHKDIRSFRLGDAEEGGEGVTIAVLR